MHKVIDVIGKNGKYYIQNFLGSNQAKIVSERHLKAVNLIEDHIWDRSTRAELNYEFGKFVGEQTFLTWGYSLSDLTLASKIFDQQIKISKQIKTIQDFMDSRIMSTLNYFIKGEYLISVFLFKKDQYKKDVVHLEVRTDQSSKKLLTAKLADDRLISFKLFYFGQHYNLTGRCLYYCTGKNSEISKVTRFSIFSTPRKIMSITKYISGKKSALFGFDNGSLNKFNYYEKGLIKASFQISKGEIINRKLYEAGKLIKNPFKQVASDFKLPIRAQKALNTFMP